jgi:hypothetical protein
MLYRLAQRLEQCRAALLRVVVLNHLPHGHVMSNTVERRGAFAVVAPQLLEQNVRLPSRCERFHSPLSRTTSAPQPAHGTLMVLMSRTLHTFEGASTQ